MPEINETTHVVMKNVLVVYRRERSSIWQCRFKVDGTWQRASTKERDLEKAKLIADGLRVEAEIRKRSNLPVVTRKFSNIAKLAIDAMKKDLANGKGKVSYNDYIRVIEDYLIPCLGNRNVTSIDYAVLNELDAWRIKKMGKAPSHSTLQTQNAALNRVFDEAISRNFLTESKRPKLDAKGRASERRASFDMTEVRALIAGFDSWIERGRNDDSKASRALMRDYAMVLLDTGARPGRELLELKWKQISEKSKPVITQTGEADEEGEPVELINLNRSVEFNVTGKTGTRTIVGMERTVLALKAIGKRNYPNIEMPVLNPLVNLIKPTNDDEVFRTRNKETETLADQSSSFQKMFERYLKEHNLLIDPKTGQKRVFYSLRHTYATFALTYDKTPIHTLEVMMGTSAAMIKLHYSHLKVPEAIEQLRGEETRRLIDNSGEVDEIYKSTKPVRGSKGDKKK